ncbi:MAG: DegV family protein [Actinomycetota bacterium]|nr:DegV family protein [Actinomycetota bacterium]
MGSVAVVTDTTHYLPRELVEANDLHQVSLYVHWGGRHDRESDLPDFDAYYEHLRTASELPTTSQPSVGDFVSTYEPLLAEGRDVISIHLAAGMSGTYESALQAKAQLDEQGGGGRIEVLDSATACGGFGCVALAAAGAARGGADLDAVVERAGEARQSLKMWFCVDTLEFLRRGGRIAAASAWLGTTLRIKPILTVESEITPIERVRTSGRAFERMVDYLRSRHDDGADAWIVQHIQAPDQAERLVERGREIFGTEPLCVSEIGPVIGTHVGPGLIGVGGVPSALLRDAT